MPTAMPGNGMKEDRRVGIVNTRLRKIRELNGFTQIEMSKILNISQREYFRFEQPGYKVSPYFLRKIALLFNTSLDYIFGFTEERKRIF